MDASISHKARIDEHVIVGRYTIIEDDVVIGSGTRIGSHAVINNGTIIGNDNLISNGVHIGVEPQDYHFKGEPSRCIIGDRNIIREYSTISRATGDLCETVIGNDNFIMTYVHIAHNDTIGNDIVIASGVQLGGYVSVADHANIGGLTGVHQFCRIGKHAMLGAKSYLNSDLLPFLLARGNRARLCSVNVRGLARNGFSVQDIEMIKGTYRPLFLTGISFSDWLQTLNNTSGDKTVYDEIIQFARTTRRGILLRTKDRFGDSSAMSSDNSE